MVKEVPISFSENCGITDREIGKIREKELKRFIGYPLNILAEWKVVVPFISKDMISKLEVFVEKVIGKMNISEYDKETLFINYRDGGEPYGASDVCGKAMRIIRKNFSNTFGILGLKVVSSIKEATRDYFWKVKEYDTCGYSINGERMLKIKHGCSIYVGRESEVKEIESNLNWNKRFDSDILNIHISEANPMFYIDNDRDTICDIFSQIYLRQGKISWKIRWEARQIQNPSHF